MVASRRGYLPGRMAVLGTVGFIISLHGASTVEVVVTVVSTIVTFLLLARFVAAEPGTRTLHLRRPRPPGGGARGTSDDSDRFGGVRYPDPPAS